MAADKTLIKARLPRGFADREAADIRATEAMVAAIRRVYERYGFEPVETPFAEYTETLGKFLPDQDRPNEGVFSFQDAGGQEARRTGGPTGNKEEARSGGAATGTEGEWVSLRYDLTAPLARYYAENHERLAKPYRSYRFGWVFRNEKPGPGRFRQFLQFDADTVGAASPAADAEMCMMAADTMEELLGGREAARGKYVIKVNSRKVLDGVMEAIGVTDEHQKLTVLRAIDKLDRLGIEGVRALLGKGRKDESGDFTSGALLETWQTEVLFETTLESDEDGFGIIGTTVALPDGRTVDEASSSYLEGRSELEDIQDYVRDAGYGPERIRIDPSVVRGPRVLHRPGVRGGAAGRDPQRKGPAGGVRLGRRWRAL